ncbi:ABC transporter substrate-binding protein [Aminipila butyrica]|uniref:ABC transporter substrate-binding protein n=1 Tax=Aminipila butyrica TaxID=433296 RepID=A0A858BRZ7_9FIRM|nr:ABC transporter substrate-binding protein [Aminipila butyrica]QIB67969.1 ABC transporter substrate-binding protein [Aminipila butyrica]
MKKGNIKRRWLSALLICALLFTAVGCAGTAGGKTSSKKSDLIDFSIGYLPSTGHLLYFVAKDKGFFEEEGLNADLVLFAENNSMLTALENKKLQAGALGSTNSIQYISQGHKVTIFGGAMTEGHALVVKKEVVEGLGDKADLSALKGKRIADTFGGTADVVFRQGLIDAGLDPEKDVELVSAESGAAAFAALKNDEIDGAILFTPFRKLAEDAGYKILSYSGEVEGFGHHPCCRQVAETAELEKNPDTYVKFLRALIKAYKFYQENEEETVDIIANYVDIDKDILKAETYGKYISSNPDPDRASTVTFYDAMVNLKYVEPFDIEASINTELYEKALASIIKEKPEDKVYQSLVKYHEENK